MLLADPDSGLHPEGLHPTRGIAVALSIVLNTILMLGLILIVGGVA